MLDPMCHPGSDQDWIDLFQEQQRFMCNVFVKTALTDKGKSFVRDAEAESDAQAVCKQLIDHHKKSADAKLKASDILTCITNIRWGDSHWKGTATAFVLHWMNQVHLCTEMTGTKFDDTVKLTLLQNAIFPSEALRATQDTANQSRANTGKASTCDQYLSLVESAAQACDGQFQVSHSNAPSSAASRTRHICAHDQDHPLPPDESACHIDANTHDSQARDLTDDDPTQTLNVFQASQHVQMGRDKWHQLDDNSKQIWDQLSDENKAITLSQTMQLATPSNSLNSLQRVHFHDQQSTNTHEQSVTSDMNSILANMSAQEHIRLVSLHDTLPSIVSTDQSGSLAGSAISSDDPSPVLAMMTKQKVAPPGDVHHALSSSMGRSPSSSKSSVKFNGKKHQEINESEVMSANGKCCHQVNENVICKVSQ